MLLVYYRHQIISGIRDYIHEFFVGITTMTDQEPELVIICTVEDELTANVLKSHLESEGIPVLLKSASFGASYGPIAGGYRGPMSVLVPSKFAEDAKLIIEPKESVEDEESCAFCYHCGAEIANKTDSIYCKCGAEIKATEPVHQKNVALNCPRCGTIMTIKDKHQKKNIFGGNKDYYICPECGKKTAVPKE
jgi:hypothetical protein